LHNGGRLRLAARDRKYSGAGQGSQCRHTKADPAQDCQREESQRRPHDRNSAGKMCLVLSHRFAPPPK
jgi:hypothetical protein